MLTECVNEVRRVLRLPTNVSLPRVQFLCNVINCIVIMLLPGIVAHNPNHLKYILYFFNFSGIAVQIIATLSNVPSIGDAYLPSGRAMLQNLPSVICARVLNPKRGEKVLDMCAAPANKTTHLAELMKDDGWIVAIDKTPNKLKILEEKIESYEFKSVKCFAYDSTKLLSNDSSDDTIEPPFPGQFFDKILLDAPCSALGNRPILRNDISPKMLKSYPVVQKKLFKAAFELLKKNGILVYSTCTVTSSENEEIVQWALNKFDGIELISADPLLGGPGWSNVGLSDDQRYCSQILSNNFFNLILFQDFSATFRT